MHRYRVRSKVATNFPWGGRRASIMATMSAEQRRATMTTRLLRRDQPAAVPDNDWLGSTMEQRIAAVWNLTLECLAWTQPDADQPRLSRSICRTERRRG